MLRALTRLTRNWKWIAGLAVAVAVGVLAYSRLAPQPGPAPGVDLSPRPSAPPPETRYDPIFPEHPGGTYAGVVVGPDEQPVRGARVFLIATDPDAKTVIGAVQPDGSVQAEEVPNAGRFRSLGEPLTTDADGRWSGGAGNATVVALAAFHMQFAPGLLAGTKEQPLRPGTDLVIRLPAAGWFKGTVVDAVTKEGIGGADVAIFIQPPSNQERPGPVAWSAANQWPKFQQWLEEEFAPRVWSMGSRPGEAGLHVSTKSDGTFSFGPVTSEAQLEFVVSHGEYKWTDMDPEVFFPGDNPPPGPGEKPRDKPLGRVRRTVVPPGKTVERTFPLVKGNVIAGKVADDLGMPIERARVVVEHVVPYFQHPWYKDHERYSWTKEDGSFRVAGLSYGPYLVRLEHDSFGTKYYEQVPENALDLRFVVPARAWLEATVAGGPVDVATYVARVVLDPLAADSARREERVTVSGGRFAIAELAPGRWRMWMEAGTYVSAPLEFLAEPGKRAAVDLALSGGGSLRVVVRDSSGRAVDPATVDLEAVSAEGTRRGARFVTREGVAEGRGILPGTYRALIRGSGIGFVAERTEPFEVKPDSLADLGFVTLRRHGFIEYQQPRYERGGTPTVDTYLFIGQDGKEPVKQKTLVTGRIPVAPGTVVVRVEGQDGSRFEKSYEVGEGERVPVQPILSPP